MKKWINITVAVLLLMACEDSGNADYSTISGIWKVEEIDQYSNVRNYSVDIDNIVGYDNVFIISNFHNAGPDDFIKATLTDSILSFTDGIGGVFVDGQGVVSSDNRKISLVYEADQGNGMKVYSALFYR